MRTYTVELKDNIAEALEQEAETMGMSADELIRFTVGERLRFLVAASRTAAEPPDYTNLTVKAIKTFMAVSGQLSCKHCTQHLTEEDVDKAECSHCGGTV